MVAVAAAMCPQDSLADTAAHACALSTRPLATGRLTHGERLRASHMGDLNREHLIPQWLLPAAVGAVAHEGSDEAADGC